MVAPAATPVTTPPATVADVVLLLQVPPAMSVVNVVVAVAHTVLLPVIVARAGVVETTTCIVSLTVPQSPVTEYDIIAVPADTPVTTPPITIAVLLLLLLHVPPATALLSVVVVAVHTDGVPVIVPASANGLTVNSIVSMAVPHPLATL